MFPNISLESEMQLLFTALLVLFLFDIFADHLSIQSHCVNAVALGPRMFAAVWFRLQIRELLEYSYCRTTFCCANQVRYRDLWKRHAYQVNMICVDIELHNLASQVTAEYLDAIANFLSDRTAQYAESIFWYPYQVILAMSYRVWWLTKPVHLLLLCSKLRERLESRVSR